jgi:hypothetical protein
MLVLVSSAAHGERLESLKNFTGIWAPAEGGAAPPSVACKKELSSGGKRTPSEARPYELLGICQRGIDYLYQPTYCDATNITPQGTSVEFDERCTTKGDYIDEFHCCRALLPNQMADILLRRSSVISAATRPTTAFIEMVLKQIDEARAIGTAIQLRRSKGKPRH